MANAQRIRINNTGTTEIVVSYQRLSDEQWIYGERILPNQTRTFWIVGKNIRISDPKFIDFVDRIEKNPNFFPEIEFFPILTRVLINPLFTTPTPTPTKTPTKTPIVQPPTSEICGAFLIVLTENANDAGLYFYNVDTKVKTKINVPNPPFISGYPPFVRPANTSWSVPIATDGNFLWMYDDDIKEYRIDNLESGTPTLTFLRNVRLSVNPMAALGYIRPNRLITMDGWSINPRQLVEFDISTNPSTNVRRINLPGGASVYGDIVYTIENKLLVSVWGYEGKDGVLQFNYTTGAFEGFKQTEFPSASMFTHKGKLYFDGRILNLSTFEYDNVGLYVSDNPNNFDYQLYDNNFTINTLPNDSAPICRSFTFNPASPRPTPTPTITPTKTTTPSNTPNPLTGCVSTIKVDVNWINNIKYERPNTARSEQLYSYVTNLNTNKSFDSKPSFNSACLACQEAVNYPSITTMGGPNVYTDFKVGSVVYNSYIQSGDPECKILSNVPGWYFTLGSEVTDTGDWVRYCGDIIYINQYGVIQAKGKCGGVPPKLDLNNILFNPGCGININYLDCCGKQKSLFIAEYEAYTSQYIFTGLSVQVGSVYSELNQSAITKVYYSEPISQPICPTSTPTPTPTPTSEEKIKIILTCCHSNDLLGTNIEVEMYPSQFDPSQLYIDENYFGWYYAGSPNIIKTSNYTPTSLTKAGPINEGCMKLAEAIGQICPESIQPTPTPTPTNIYQNSTYMRLCGCDQETQIIIKPQNLVIDVTKLYKDNNGRFWIPIIGDSWEVNTSYQATYFEETYIGNMYPSEACEKYAEAIGLPQGDYCYPDITLTPTTTPSPTPTQILNCNCHTVENYGFGNCVIQWLDCYGEESEVCLSSGETLTICAIPGSVNSTCPSGSTILVTSGSACNEFSQCLPTPTPTPTATITPTLSICQSYRVYVSDVFLKYAEAVGGGDSEWNQLTWELEYVDCCGRTIKTIQKDAYVDICAKSIKPSPVFENISNLYNAVLLGDCDSSCVGSVNMYVSERSDIRFSATTCDGNIVVYSKQNVLPGYYTVNSSWFNLNACFQKGSFISSSYLLTFDYEVSLSCIGCNPSTPYVTPTPTSSKLPECSKYLVQASDYVGLDLTYSFQYINNQGKTVYDTIKEGQTKIIYAKSILTSIPKLIYFTRLGDCTECEDLSPIQAIFGKAKELVTSNTFNNFYDAIKGVLKSGGTNFNGGTFEGVEICCPESCDGSNNGRYVLANNETYLKYAEAVGITQGYYKDNCCKDVVATPETYSLYYEITLDNANSYIVSSAGTLYTVSELINPEITGPLCEVLSFESCGGINPDPTTNPIFQQSSCGLNTKQCIDDLVVLSNNELLNLTGDTLSIYDKGIVEYNNTTGKIQSGLCDILNILSNENISGVEAANIVDLILNDGVIIDCNCGNIIVASVETYLKYAEAVGVTPENGGGAVPVSALLSEIIYTGTSCPTPTPTKTPTTTPTPTPTQTSTQPLIQPTTTPTSTIGFMGETPTPTPSTPQTSICVTNAGTPVANGNYIFSGIVNGRPSYSKGSKHSIFWTGGLWVIRQVTSDGTIDFYYSIQDVATPNLVQYWYTNGGILPLPSITLGICPNVTPTPTSTPCYCPSGYTLDERSKRCYKEVIIDPITANTTEIAHVRANAAFGDFGFLIYDQYDTSGSATNAYSYNGTYQGVNSGLTDQHTFWMNRLNFVGVWVKDNPDWPGWSLPYPGKVSFCTTINIPTEKTYYLGFAADNDARIVVNGQTIISQITDERDSNFKYWHIYPITISAGETIIEIEGWNRSLIGAFAAEIYDNTLSQLTAATNINQLNVVFSTGDYLDNRDLYGCNRNCPDRGRFDEPRGVCLMGTAPRGSKFGQGFCATKRCPNGSTPTGDTYDFKCKTREYVSCGPNPTPTPTATPTATKLPCYSTVTFNPSIPYTNPYVSYYDCCDGITKGNIILQSGTTSFTLTGGCIQEGSFWVAYYDSTGITYSNLCDCTTITPTPTPTNTSTPTNTPTPTQTPEVISQFCEECNIGFSLLRNNLPAYIQVGNLTGTCQVTDYQILWYNLETGLVEFKSGSGTEFEYDVSHPVNRPSFTGVYKPVVNKVKLLSGTIFDNLSGNCFGNITVVDIDCYNGNNTATFAPQSFYSHEYIFNNASYLAPPSSLKLRMSLGLETNFVPFYFAGLNIPDNLKITFLSDIYQEPIVIENCNIGGFGSNYFQPELPVKTAYFSLQKVLTLTGLTRDVNDTLLIEVTPNGINPQTNWSLYLKCLTGFSQTLCQDYDFQIPYKIIPESVTSIFNGCETRPYMDLSGCTTDSEYLSDVLKYMPVGNAINPSDNTGIITLNFIYNPLKPETFTCYNSTTGGFNDCETPLLPTESRRITVKRSVGNLLLEFADFSDFNTYFDGYLSNIGDFINDPSNINYYQCVMFTTPEISNELENCGDGTGFDRFYIHKSSIVTTGQTSANTYTINFTMPQITKQLNILGCTNCNEVIEGIVYDINNSSQVWSTDFSSTTITNNRYTQPFGERMAFLTTSSYDSAIDLRQFCFIEYSNKTYPMSGTPLTLIPSLSGQASSFTNMKLFSEEDASFGWYNRDFIGIKATIPQGVQLSAYTGSDFDLYASVIVDNVFAGKNSVNDACSIYSTQYLKIGTYINSQLTILRPEYFTGPITLNGQSIYQFIENL